MDNKKICEDFLTKIINSNYMEAFGLVKPLSVMGDAALDNLMIQTQSQIEMIKPRFGQMLGFDLVKEESLNDVLAKYSYIVRFENMLITFSFFFYKPKDKYVIVALNWSDNFKELFD